MWFLKQEALSFLSFEVRSMQCSTDRWEESSSIQSLSATFACCSQRHIYMQL